MMKRSLSIFDLVSGLSFLPVPAAADFIVPGSLAAVEGNLNNAFPFNTGSEMRYQQVYAAAEFGSDPFWIDAILFRPDSEFGDAFAKSYPSVQINLSTTSAAPDGLSNTFAANVGADDTIVRSGLLTLSSADMVGPGTTRAFDILIPFTTSFLYNPTLGNLLLDVRTANSAGFATQFDAHNVVGDSVSRVFAFGATTPSGGTDSLGLVTKFQTSSVNAVPDPASSFLLLVMGIGSVLTVRRWAKSA
jgi:hypothetical protein